MKTDNKKTESVFLVGPFVGEFWWECFYFAPYVTYLKKEHPQKRIIVFTRPTRFDLYGNYADILVPLKIKNDDEKLQQCFRMKEFDNTYYDTLVDICYKKYSKRFSIIDHIYPDVSMFFYKVKWQLSRSLMDYDFKPRKKNRELIKEFVNARDILIDNIIDNTQRKGMKQLSNIMFNVGHLLDYRESTYFGCIIEAIKTCEAVVGNLTSNISRMALLLKKPLIAIDEKFTDDQIHLINPYNIPVIKASNIKDGMEIYEKM